MNTSQISPITQTSPGGADWRELLAHPGERDHTVQLYSDSDFLTRTVCHYARTGLLKGDAVLLVATPPNRLAFTRDLQRSGIDVRQRIDRGQLTLLDAAETMSRFMAGGMPDPAAFLPLIGGVVDLARVRGGYTRVRAYGEMVNLLWETGELAAAIRLEELWNELGRTHAFSLHCAYAMDIFDAAIHCCGSALDGIHHTHSHVIAAEHPSRLDDALSRALADVLGPAEAARSVADLPPLSDSGDLILRLPRGLTAAQAERVLGEARRCYNLTPTTPGPTLN